MDTIFFTGSTNGLKGQVEIEGEKNAVLPLLAATFLASQGQTKMTQVPILSDVYTINNVVR
ncbi:UDP-N-acetylglucosamine 1-carboxyvinyltransferase, partial [Streptococcus suis]